MKILIILDSFGSGGAQKLAVNLASGFINKNHEVHIFRYDDKSNFFEPEINSLGIKVIQPKKINVNKILRGIKIIRSIRNSLIENKYDGIISFLHIPSFYSSIAKIGIYKGKLVVCELSSSLAPVRLHTKILFFIACILSNKVVANSHSEAKIIGSRFMLLGKTHSIYNGLNISKTKNDIAIKKKEKTILIIARVAYPKNGLNLLKGILCFYKKNGWAPQIDWFGRFDNDSKSSKMQNQMNDLISKNQILKDKFEFKGETKNVSLLYNSYEALLLPSIYEGLPLVICESMINKCLVLASNVCDHPKILSENRGIIFDPTDPYSISNAIEDLFNLSKTQKKTMEEKSFNFCSKKLFNRKMTDSFEEIIK